MFKTKADQVLSKNFPRFFVSFNKIFLGISLANFAQKSRRFYNVLVYACDNINVTSFITTRIQLILFYLRTCVRKCFANWQLLFEFATCSLTEANWFDMDKVWQKDKRKCSLSD